MSLSLHTIKPTANSKKRKKRVGRGNASGHGTYSTRGLKGQKARSGSSGLKLKGFKQNLLNIPKVRGFKSIHHKPFVINISVLDKKFKKGEVISPLSLKAKGLLGKKDKQVKILGKGEISKKVIVEKCQVSAGAKRAIEKAGGKVK